MCKEGGARHMTIDKAIEHALRCATDSNGERADEYRQVALWLTELRDIRRVWNNLVTAYEGTCKRYNETDEAYITTVSYLYGKAARAEAESAKLRELVRDMWNDGMCDCDEYGVCSEYGVCAKCEYGYPDRMRELGIEVG